MKWLAKDRYNFIDVAGITLMVTRLLNDEFFAAFLTLIATYALSTAVCVIAKKGQQ